MIQSRAPGFPVDALRDPRTPEDFENLLMRRWGRNFRNPRCVFSELHSLPTLPLVQPKLMRWVRQKSRYPSIGIAEWNKRQSWAIWAEPYIIDLVEFEVICREAKHLEDANEIREVLVSLIDQDSLEPLRELSKAETSVLFCDAHAGALHSMEFVLRETLRSDLLSLVGPLLLVAGRSAASRIHAVEPVSAFYRIVKHLRQPKGYAIISADGPRGDAHYEIDLFGRTVTLATGAAHAVFYAKCQTAFCIAKWKADKIVFDVRFDTQWQSGEPIGEWTRRWMERYRCLLIDVMTGEPENVRGVGGFYQQLRSSL